VGLVILAEAGSRTTEGKEFVIPAHAGIQTIQNRFNAFLDSGLRRNDERFS